MKKNNVNTGIEYLSNQIVKNFKENLLQTGIPLDCMMFTACFEKQDVDEMAHIEGLSKIMFLNALKQSLSKRLNKKGFKVIWQRDTDGYFITIMPSSYYYEKFKVA